MAFPFPVTARVELARHVDRTPSMPTLSASTIGRWLSAEKIRGFRYHSWQHIQNPDEFLSRARPVLRLYEHATTLLGTCGSGSFVLMRKRRFKRERLSKLLVRLSRSIPCTSHLVITDTEQ